jgi:hypothetical protein
VEPEETAVDRQRLGKHIPVEKVVRGTYRQQSVHIIFLLFSK